jgi:hypothetical protein
MLQVRPIPGQGPGPVETTNTETIGLPGPRVSVIRRTTIVYNLADGICEVRVLTLKCSNHSNQN